MTVDRCWPNDEDNECNSVGSNLVSHDEPKVQGQALDSVSSYGILLKNGLFFFVFVFSIQLTVKMFNINFCWWRDSNRGPLESEATALPTEPQPLPYGTLLQASFLFYLTRAKILRYLIVFHKLANFSAADNWLFSSNNFFSHLGTAIKLRLSTGPLVSHQWPIL